MIWKIFLLPRVLNFGCAEKQVSVITTVFATLWHLITWRKRVIFRQGPVPLEVLLNRRVLKSGRTKQIENWSEYIIVRNIGHIYKKF